METAHIDGDILVYRVGFASEDTTEEFAVSRVQHTIREWRNLSGAVKARGYLTAAGQDNFRFQVATTLPYKGHRQQPKPLHYHTLRKFLIDGMGFQVSKGEEADDLLGIALRDDPEGSVVLTLDKDLNNVPGWHINPVSDPIPKFITTQEAVVNFARQVLTGDSTDNVPGVFKHFGHLRSPAVKIGPKRAEALIPDDTKPDEVWDQVMHGYASAAPDGAEWSTLYKAALETAQLVWIRWEKDQMFDPNYLKELKW